MKRLALFALLTVGIVYLPVLAQQQTKPPVKKDDKKKKEDDKKKKEAEKNVGLKLSEGDKVVSASVNLVDPKRGLFIVAIPFMGGHKFVEYKINDQTKFYGTDKKEMKDGFKSDAFQSPNQRLNLPINLVFDASGQVKAIALEKQGQ